MRKVIYIILLGLMVLNLGNSTIRAQKEASDLETILGVISQHQDMSIKEWSITARQLIDGIETKEQFFLEADRLKESLSEFTWQVRQDQQVIVIVGVRQTSMFVETVTLASALTSNTSSYMNYEIAGTDVSSEVLEQLQEKTTAVKHFAFGRDTIFFTCVKGEISGNIDKVLTSKPDNLMAGFRAAEMESIKEKHFVSITANSSLFEQSLISEQYNLQLAMRNDGMGQKTSFVIGTPIITFEY